MPSVAPESGGAGEEETDLVSVTAHLSCQPCWLRLAARATLGEAMKAKSQQENQVRGADLLTDTASVWSAWADRGKGFVGGRCWHTGPHAAACYRHPGQQSPAGSLESWPCCAFHHPPSCTDAGGSASAVDISFESMVIFS